MITRTSKSRNILWKSWTFAKIRQIWQILLLKFLNYLIHTYFSCCSFFFSLFMEHKVKLKPIRIIIRYAFFNTNFVKIWNLVPKEVKYLIFVILLIFLVFEVRKWPGYEKCSEMFKRFDFFGSTTKFCILRALIVFKDFIWKKNSKKKKNLQVHQILN